MLNKKNFQVLFLHFTAYGIICSHPVSVQRELGYITGICDVCKDILFVGVMKTGVCQAYSLELLDYGRTVFLGSH